MMERERGRKFVRRKRGGFFFVIERIEKVFPSVVRGSLMDVSSLEIRYTKLVRRDSRYGCTSNADIGKLEFSLVH